VGGQRLFGPLSAVEWAVHVYSALAEGNDRQKGKAGTEGLEAGKAGRFRSYCRQGFGN
jgi:hypothetical protein